MYFAVHVYIAGMVENATLQCENCGSEKFYALVQYGSYFLKCYDCRQPVVATSLIAVVPLLNGTFEIIEVDEKMNELGLIAEGEIGSYVGIIKQEASKGKILWLKKRDVAAHHAE